MIRTCVILLIAACALAGCVERTLTIESDPAGAVVYIADDEKGTTPLKLPFTFYGDYAITLRMDGYETLKTHANLDTPWYEAPGIDFFSEIAPWTYHDQRTVRFTLTPKQTPTPEELKARAEAARTEALSDSPAEKK